MARPKKVAVIIYHVCEDGTERRNALDRSLRQNHRIISFCLTPKLSGLAVVITEEIDFYILQK